MRNTILFFILGILLMSCGKSKFATEPQIEFKTFSPTNTLLSSTTSDQPNLPKLVMRVTDKEGDLGFKNGSDTAWVYLRNLLTNKFDSLQFPDISSVESKNFDGDVLVNIFDIIQGTTRPGPKVDTIRYEVYVKDFAKNKSNVITTDNFYFVTQ